MEVHMGKYDDLSRFLNSQSTELVRVDFEAIEEALGFSLPASARKYAEWWSNNYGGHVQARAWMDAGWQTESVDLAARKVSFRRLTRRTSVSKGGDPAASAAPDVEAARPNRWGCMAGTVTFMPGVDLTEPTEDWNAERDAPQ
jgi:hypothetical protein